MTIGAEARRLVLRWLERALVAAGVACLAWSGQVWLEAAVYQRAQRDAVEHSLSAGPVHSPPTSVRPGSLIGVLDIPRLRLSAAVAEGDDDRTLRVGIGHLPDTPLPWENGNSALAAHRDTFFRPLRNVRAGDELRLTTVHGDFRYIVSDTMVVDAEDVWVLEPREKPTLTLITCYPFDYVGPAPPRFIVQGERIDAN